MIGPALNAEPLELRASEIPPCIHIGIPIKGISIAPEWDSVIGR